MHARGTRDQTAPTDIEEFRIVRMLGRGGMGAVYLAHDTILDRAVALKLVRVGTSEESRVRFLTEARAIARIDHPNIIGIYRAGTTSAGEPYLVQELVRGQSIDRVGLPFPERRCLEVATAIARGLAAAHRHGVLHRDVKPSNIMIDAAGTPRLLDFGLAKLTGSVSIELGLARGSGDTHVEEVGGVDSTAELSPESEDATPAAPPPPPVPAPSTSIDGFASPSRVGLPLDHTSPGALLGTPRYMAPELWRAEPAASQSDLYSLGVVMYELLSGAPPYPQTDRASLERAVLDGPPPRPIGECVPGLDPAFAALVMRCLARDPADRPESADEVVYQLERIAAGAPPVPEGNPYRGLAPFEAEQRAVFFGRGPEVSAIVDRLRSASLVVIAGDSGIGKSSLCRAGVVPAIASGGLGDRRTWTTRTMTPGRDCIAALGDTLGGLPSFGALPATAEGNQLAPALARHLAVGADRGLVIFVDQLEELVTQNPAFLAAHAAEILAALGSGIPGVKVILAVRGDFFTRVAALPGLRTVATRSLHLVRGLSPDDARDAVESPARAKGAQFETRAMVDALVASIVDRPSALPLLQFALSELWQRRDAERAVIPERALAEIGGVSGALARYADQMLTALAAPERSAARRILLALVTAEGTRASRVRSELVSAADDATAAALEALVSGRLIVARDVADGPPVYELAHESLLEAWGTLRGWLDDAAGQRAVRVRLGAAADEWHRRGRPRELLWRRSQLAETASLPELTAGDRAFLDASRRNARLRFALAVALAAAIPAAAAITWWRAARDEAARREDNVIAALRSARESMWNAWGQAAQARQIEDEAVALFRNANASVPWRIPNLPGMQAVMEEAKKDKDEDAYEARESRWDDAMQVFARARADMSDATRQGEAALAFGALQDLVHERIAWTLYEQALLADALRDQQAVLQLEERLNRYPPDALDRKGGLYAALWQRRVAVTISAETATRIEIARYSSSYTLQPSCVSGEEPSGAPSGSVRTTPCVVNGHKLTTELAPGSYRATLRAPDIAPVMLPFVVPRHGDPMTLRVALPRPGSVPEGYVYIPAGTFLQGSDDQRVQDLIQVRRNFLRTAPLHEEVTGAYLISAHEVTFADWLRYLRSLPHAERDRRRQKAANMDRNASVKLEYRGGKFEITLHTIRETLRAVEGKPLRYRYRKAVRWENTPASGVRLDDAIAYMAWLSTLHGKDAVPGARPCTPLEWERAARGADGRVFPHGNRLLRDDANIDGTYDRDYLGPDEIGSHPASDSPFGVADMSGNAFEWVQNGPEVTLRGGSWYNSPTTAWTMNATVTQSTRDEAYIGIRVCADADVTARPEGRR